jgi:hypothetical protein
MRPSPAQEARSSMKLHAPSFSLANRLRAAGTHLLICLVIAALAATLVFAVWYPWPYRIISGGQDLFVLVVSVDLVLGPLLTFAIFDVAKKGWPHVRRDLVVIGVLQLAALIYGLYTVYQVRPVAMVLEVDRFRVVMAADVYEPELPEAPEAYRRLPLTGPWLLGTRPTRPGVERTDAIFKGLEGIDISQRPKFWQDYQLSKEAALIRARPVSLLQQHYPTRSAEIDAALAKANLREADARFLPLMARRDWVVLLDARGDVSGFLPLDGFF